MTRLLLVAGLCASLLTVASTACSTMPSGPRETCGNGVDDDNNGLIDCADPDCKGKQECFFDGGFYGTCSKCGQTCQRQTQCLQTSYFNDVPLPTCESLDGGPELRCSALRKNVQVNLSMNVDRYRGTTFASVATRFINRRLTDGGLLTCTDVEQVASGRTAAESGQLEDAGVFSLAALDVRRQTGSGDITVPFVNVLTIDSFLIWSELWTGTPDGITKYPTGIRRGFECFDGPAIGQAWPPITELDNCAPAGVDAGAGANCRTFRVTATRGP